MKRKYVGFVLIVLLVIFGAGCKTAPRVEEEPPVVEVVPELTSEPSEAELGALNAAINRAGHSRVLTAYFDGDELFPSEWYEVELLFTQAVDQNDTSTSESTNESTARYVEAAEGYEVLAYNTLSVRFWEMERQLLRVRDGALSAGAYELVPEYLFQADDVIEGAEIKFMNEDYYAASDDALTAMVMYRALWAGLDAYNTREEVAWAAGLMIPEPFLRADIVFERALDSWDEMNYSAAYDSAHVAHSIYHAIGVGTDAYIDSYQDRSR